MIDVKSPKSIGKAATMTVVICSVRQRRTVIIAE
jgi:hypothetical protein